MTTWVGLEGIILSKKKWDRERHIPYDLTYTWNLKTKTKINKQKPKLIDSENRLMVTRGREWEGGWEMGKGSQKIQSFGYKINKPSIWKVQNSQIYRDGK